MTTGLTHFSEDSMSAAFALVFRSSSLGLCVVDQEFRCVEVSPAASEMFGRSRDELLGTSILEATSPEDRRRDEVLVARLFAGEISHFELDRHWVRRDGTLFFGHLIAGVLREGGRPPRALAIVEEQDRRAASPRGDSLACDVAHDLNNLLTVIRGSAGSLESSLGEAKELTVIEETVERATLLLRDLLSAGGRVEHFEARCSVREVVARLKPVLEGLLPEGVWIEVRSDGSDPHVSLTPIQLDQLLINLVVNARDAISDTGGIEVGIESSPERAHLSVHDTGEGMSAKTLERAFDPRFTTKPAGHGRGLGLAIVRSLVEQAGGTVDASSAPGAGTRISIDLPRA